MLAKALPAAARDAGSQASCDRIIQLLGALAAGYTCALRDLICQPGPDQVAADPSRILSQAAQAWVQVVRSAGIDVVAFPVDSAEQAACWHWIGANWAVVTLWPSIEPWLDG